jgi:sulfatase maturation enzyme AslB (radical SAM superfamily)
MLNALYRIPEIDGHSNIEIQISNGCNLTCQSCSHYTNVGGGKNLDVDTISEWISLWNGRITPKHFIIMGGEPTLNRDLTEITEVSARLWASSTIKIVTNGFFLGKHPGLPLVMKKYGVELEISLKSEDEEYLKKIAPVKNLVEGWVRDFGVKVKWRKDYKNWLKVYHGYGPGIKPFEDGDPGQSFRACGQKVCRVLHEGSIWKCPRLAYLHIYKKRFDLDSSWNQYLKYEPLGSSASMREIRSFFEQEEIPECAMCPANKIPMVLPSPMTSAKELLK